MTPEDEKLCSLLDQQALTAEWAGDQDAFEKAAARIRALSAEIADQNVRAARVANDVFDRQWQSLQAQIEAKDRALAEAISFVSPMAAEDKSMRPMVKRWEKAREGKP